MIQTKIFKHIYPDALESMVNKFLEEEQKKYIYFHLVSSHLSVDTGSIVCQLYFDRNDASFLPDKEAALRYISDKLDEDPDYFCEPDPEEKEDHEEDEIYGDY